MRTAIWIENIVGKYSLNVNEVYQDEAYKLLEKEYIQNSLELNNVQQLSASSFEYGQKHLKHQEQIVKDAKEEEKNRLEASQLASKIRTLNAMPSYVKPYNAGTLTSEYSKQINALGYKLLPDFNIEKM